MFCHVINEHTHPAGPRRAEVEAALANADVFFGSLLFDFDQVLLCCAVSYCAVLYCLPYCAVLEARWMAAHRRKHAAGMHRLFPASITAANCLLHPNPALHVSAPCHAPLICPQVEWLKARLERVPVRFCFESSLELMEATQVGGFKMAPGGKSKGPPPAVKKVRWGWGHFGGER